ncbi:Rad4p [Sugiyamaella lignohabitans]|uniref:Rad4p n=1 Tax=Sugiyamaella lignohabitans TaxID=796027 RepID=A0A167CXH3_9ASCO|nr:Rad4p [Sugiyamaella lignohabitans]ANB12226.1 Rad4p [Sugiyamaella lignohabitans]
MAKRRQTVSAVETKSKRIKPESPAPAATVVDNEQALERMLSPSSDGNSSASESSRSEHNGVWGSAPAAGGKGDPPEDSSSDEDSDDDIDWADVDLQQGEVPELKVAEKIEISTKIDPQPEEDPVSAEREERRRKVEAANREKVIRLTTHVLHVQALLHHGSVRNEWINDSKLQKTLKEKLPKPLRSAFRKHAKHVDSGKNIRKPDEVIDNLAVLVTKLALYFRKQFEITKPGLTVHGYYQQGDNTDGSTGALDSEEFILKCSEREQFTDFEDFYNTAVTLKGSRDLGAQVFACILRSLGVETRLVFSPPLLGYSLHKREQFVPDKDGRKRKTGSSRKSMSRGATPDDVGEHQRVIDSNLAYPIFWCEIYDPRLQSYIAIDPMILPFPDYEDLLNGKYAAEKPAQFEPQGPYAGSQKMYYVVAYEDDSNCRDLTPKYMSSKTVPQIITLTATSLVRPMAASSFKDVAYLLYLRSVWLMARALNKKSDKLRAEDAQMRKWIAAKSSTENGSESTEPSYPNVLSAYKSHPTLVLHSKLYKSQTLRPGAKPVHKFDIKSAKGTRTEIVYHQKDVVNCRPQAAWYKEGRVIKPGEKPMIIEKAKPSTRNGKRKLETSIKYGDNPEVVEQGLYSYEQTMEYVPPEVIEGQPIPRNEFGRVEIFTPNMVPKGTVHLRYQGLGRIAKKLGIDFVPAVVGFKFQSRFAKPDIDGGIVPVNSAEILLDAWRQDQETKREKETAARNEDALTRWKLYVARLQLLRRLENKYGRTS